MKIFKNKIIMMIVISMILILIVNIQIYAADRLYRFTHNDHDALVIGEILEAEGDSIKVKVYKHIISKRDLNSNSPKKQLYIEEAKILGVKSYFLYKQLPQAGDFVIASLDNKFNTFAIANGIYKVDSTDYSRLSFLYDTDASVFTKMDAAALKAFVNSDGQSTEFSFDGNTKKVISQEDNKIIYDGNIDITNTEIKADNNSGSSNESSEVNSEHRGKFEKTQLLIFKNKVYIIAFVIISLTIVFIFKKRYCKR